MRENTMMRRCDLLSFLFDVLDFMAEQIEQAKSDSDRVAALDAASGAVPMFKQRLTENKYIAAPAILLLDQWMFVGHWRENWDALAKESAEQFAKSADDLISRIDTAKSAMQTAASMQNEVDSERDDG